MAFNNDLHDLILDVLYRDDICLDNRGGHEDAATDITKAILYKFDVTAREI